MDKLTKRTTRPHPERMRFLKRVVFLLIVVTGLAVSGRGGVAVAASKPQAAIGDTQYATLAKAVRAVKASETITVLRNITTKKRLTLSTGRTYTIDFNGCTYRYTGSASAFRLTAGSVTIKNASKLISASGLFNTRAGTSLTLYNGRYKGQIISRGNLKIYAGTYSDGGASVCEDGLIRNFGSLTVRGGRFVNRLGAVLENRRGNASLVSGTFQDKGQGAACCIRNRAGIQITGGTYDAPIYNEKGSIFIGSGTFWCDKGIPLCVVKGQITVSGGDFYATKSGLAADVQDGARLNVSGGRFHGLSMRRTSGGKITVTSRLSIRVEVTD